MAFKQFIVFVLSILNLISAAPAPQSSEIIVINPSGNANVDVTTLRESSDFASSLSPFSISGYLPQFNLPAGHITVIITGISPEIHTVRPFEIPETNEPKNSEVQSGFPSVGISSSIGTHTDSATANDFPIQNTGESTQNDPVSGTRSAEIRSGSIGQIFSSNDIPIDAGIDVNSTPNPNQGVTESKNNDQNNEHDRSSQRFLPESRTFGQTQTKSYNPWESTPKSINAWPTLHNSNPSSPQYNSNSWPVQENFHQWPLQSNPNLNTPSDFNNRNWFNTPNPTASYETTSYDSHNFDDNTQFDRQNRRPYNSALNSRSEDASSGYSSSPFDMIGHWQTF